MPDTDVTEIVTELEAYGVPSSRARVLVAQAIAVGVEVAIYRRETADKVAEVQIERQRRRGYAA